MKVIIGVLAVFLLVGCATSVVPSGSASPVPQSRVFAYQKASDGNGLLSVTRDSGHTGSFCEIGLFVDGKVVALLKPSENVVLHIPAGQVVLGAAYQGAGICGMGAADRQEREATLSEGRLRKYRISTSGDGVLDLLPTTI